jgi:cell division protein FtsB
MDENKKLSESIKQAQENPNMHIENIAREKFNLTMPDEEFIVFEEEDENE